MLDFTAGVLIGFGLSGSSFTIVLGAFGKLLPPNGVRSPSASAPLPARSANFCISPICGGVDGIVRMADRSLIFAGVMLVVPLALALAIPRGVAPFRDDRGAAILPQRWPKPSVTAVTCCW